MEENYRKLCQVFTPTENVKELLRKNTALKDELEEKIRNHYELINKKES